MFLFDYNVVLIQIELELFLISASDEKRGTGNTANIE